MPLDSYQLPVELWGEILSHILDRGLFPDPAATLFEKLDLLAHPCKIRQTVRENGYTLRLVCRLWNKIVREKQSVIFIDGIEEAVRIGHHSSRRTEIIDDWTIYCQKWPCAPNHNDIRLHNGGCQPRKVLPHRVDDSSPVYDLPNVQVLRIHKTRWGCISFLRRCINLEALFIRLPRLVPPSLKDASSLLGRMHYLSHLHLDLVTDCNHTLTLHLPALTYLGANLSLVKQTFPRRQVFPFDLEIPNVKTINLSGAIAGFYTPLLQHQINSWRESVVEMVLCSDLVESDPFLPLDQLSGFPQLTTLGLSVDGISSSTADIFAVTPLPASSPLSLVLFGLEKEIEHRDLDYCKEKLSNLFINGEQPWFSKLIVGSGWRQLAEKSYTDCEAKRGDNQETEDALSSYWPVLEYLDQKGISIEDRNGVKYRKEMGQSLQTLGSIGGN